MTATLRETRPLTLREARLEKSQVGKGIEVYGE